MVIIAASFPYRRQVEAVQKVLGLATPEAAAEKIEFHGFRVQRREVARDGSRRAWEDKAHEIPLEKYYRTLVMLTGKNFDAQGDELRPVTIESLAMPLPHQAEGKGYPEIDREVLRLEKSLRAFPIPPTAGKGARPLPDHALVRIVDVTPFEPGLTYEYRFQIRMADPRVKKGQRAADAGGGKAKELHSPWVTVPTLVTVPPDFQFYAVDMKQYEPAVFARDPMPRPGQAVVQLHRWIESADPWPDRLYKAVPVGEWAIAPRVIINQGEYVGGILPVELPVWDFFEDKVVLATGRKRPIPPMSREILESRPGINLGRLVDQAAETGRGSDAPFPGRLEIDFTPDGAPLLIHAEGGMVAYKRTKDQAATELLLLSPEGRLFVRTQEIDTYDPERRQRYADWKALVEYVKKRTKP
jgi:hypothetical protein